MSLVFRSRPGPQPMCPLQCLLLSVTHFLADPCALLLLLTHVSFCPGVTSVHPASPATLPTNHTEARSSHYLNPSQLLCLPRGTTDLGRILEPGYLGSSGQWDMMRPQKGSISEDLSSGSSMYQLNSKPTGKYKPKKVSWWNEVSFRIHPFPTRAAFSMSPLVPAHRVGIKEMALAVLNHSKHILHSPRPGPRHNWGYWYFSRQSWLLQGS